MERIWIAAALVVVLAVPVSAFAEQDAATAGKPAPLPAGADKLTARIQKLQAIAAELKKARTLGTDRHTRVVKLTKEMEALGKALAGDIAARLKELQAADAKLAALHKEAHPRRQALAEQIAFLRGAQASLPVARGAELTLDLGNGVTMKLVKIPAGTFTMGSRDSAEDVAKKGDSDAEMYEDEHPRHSVTITRPFYIGVYEVTQEQYQAVMGENPSGFKGAKNPVDTVSWDDAVAFCKALSVKTGRTLRLPTEAEWEYACRAGTTTPFHMGETISTDQANYHGKYTYGNGKKGVYREKTIPVGSFKPNAFGLYDMHGNVLEWCSDWCEDSYPNVNTTDPNGPNTGEDRVFRGGSWDAVPVNCRSALRDGYSPDERESSFGFRVVGKKEIKR